MEVTFETIFGVTCLVVRLGEKWLACKFSELTPDNASERLEALKRSVSMD